MQQGRVCAEECTGSVRRHGATYAGAASYNRPPKITTHGRTNDWAALRKTPVYSNTTMSDICRENEKKNNKKTRYKACTIGDSMSHYEN